MWRLDGPVGAGGSAGLSGGGISHLRLAPKRSRQYPDRMNFRKLIFLALLLTMAAVLCSCLHLNSKIVSPPEIEILSITPATNATFRFGQRVDVHFRYHVPETNFFISMNAYPRGKQDLDRQGITMGSWGNCISTNGTGEGTLGFKVGFKPDRSARQLALTNFNEALITNFSFTLSDMSITAQRPLTNIPVRLTWKSEP